MGLCLLIGGGLAMRLGTVNAFLPFDHVGFRHVQAAMLASQHGAGLQRGLTVGGFWPGLGRVLVLVFLFFLESTQTIFAPQPNAKQHGQ